MAVLYTAKVHTEGGRNGTARSSDGLLDLKLSLPKGLGGAENASNPEQLFAAGFGACFENAVLYIAKQEKLGVTKTSVDATVELRSTEASQADAEALVAKAHAVCPYSNATRGNIDVKLHTTAV